MKYVNERLLPHLKEGAEKSSRDLENFDIALGFPALVSESDQRFEMIKPLLATFIVATGSSPSYQTILNELGYSENLKIVSQKMKEVDVQGAVKHIPDEMVKQVSICGTPAEVRSRIEEYRTAGVNLPILNPTPPFAYYPLFPTHLPNELGEGNVDYSGLREQVKSVITAVS